MLISCLLFRIQYHYTTLPIHFTKSYPGTLFVLTVVHPSSGSESFQGPRVSSNATEPVNEVKEDKILQHSTTEDYRLLHYYNVYYVPVSV